MLWAERWASEQNALKSQGLQRTLRPREGRCDRLIQVHNRTLVNLTSNDYLGLAGDVRLTERGMEWASQWGSGAAGSRLLGGDLACAHVLEHKMAALHGRQAARIFNSGYQANVAIGNVLSMEGVKVYVDRLAHASAWDGLRIGGGRFERFAHSDVADLARRLDQYTGLKAVWIESVYSMDGDVAPIAQIWELCQHHNALLIVDEAHGDGLMGQKGLGVVSDLKLQADADLVALSTFGKAYGCFGAIMTGPQWFADACVQRGRALIYSTALPPWNLGAMDCALELAQAEPWRRNQALKLAEQARLGLRELGWDDLGSASQIVPVCVGQNTLALDLAHRLELAGLGVQAVRAPTVPEGTARLRVNWCAFHQQSDVEQFLTVLGPRSSFD